MPYLQFAIAYFTGDHASIMYHNEDARFVQKLYQNSCNGFEFAELEGVASDSESSQANRHPLGSTARLIPIFHLD